MSELTQEQKAMNDETWHHINRVQQLMLAMIITLTERLVGHDQSKLKSPEVEVFTVYTPRLKGMKYDPTPGSEYSKCLGEMQVALKHHYKHNSHHPQYYDHGIAGMDLLDLMEMLCDWKAAGERHEDGGDLERSIVQNTQRFAIDQQLKSILENTARRHIIK